MRYGVIFAWCNRPTIGFYWKPVELNKKEERKEIGKQPDRTGVEPFLSFLASYDFFIAWRTVGGTFFMEQDQKALFVDP